MTETLYTKYLIIGNSAGGIGAVEAIREVDGYGTITMVSDEPYPAYSRPLVSKYLAGERTIENMRFRSVDFYDKNSIKVLLNKTLTQLKADERKARLDDGMGIVWEKLLLATGGAPIMPQIVGGNNPAVFTFNKMDDARAISKYLKEGMRIVVIGGGLIGVSVAEALVKRGVKVTIIEMKDRILNTILDETASAIATTILEQNEVKIIVNHTVTEINGEFTTDRIYAVTLDDTRSVSCDAVIVAVGVKPRVDIARNTGLKINRGIVVNNRMQTSSPDIYACGDVAEIYDFIHNERRVIPIWPNAYIGGRIAGFNMAGVHTESSGFTSMNSLNYFGMNIVSAGTVMAPDETFETVSRRDSRNYRKVILKDGLIIGFIYSGNIEQSGIVYGLMKDRVDVSAFKPALMADDFSFVSMPEPLWRHRLADAFLKNNESESIMEILR